MGLRKVPPAEWAGVRGLGQRMFVTDSGDYPLLDTRSILFGTAQGDSHLRRKQALAFLRRSDQVGLIGRAFGQIEQNGIVPHFRSCRQADEDAEDDHRPHRGTVRVDPDR